MTENDAAIATGNASGSYPSADANVAFYEAFAPYYERLYAGVDVPETIRQWLLLLKDNGILTRESLTHESRPKLIDVGCGPGWHLVAWAEAGFIVSGLDSSAAMLSLAARHVERASPKRAIPLYRADIRTLVKLDTVSERFDLAVSHLNFLNLFAARELEDAFGGVAKLVKPGGYWIADYSMPKERPSDVRETHADEGISLIGKFQATDGHYEQRWLTQELDCVEYYWFHSRHQYQAAATAAGWKLVECFEWRPENSELPWHPLNSGSERMCLILRRMMPPVKPDTPRDGSLRDDESISRACPSEVEDN